MGVRSRDFKMSWLWNRDRKKEKPSEAKEPKEDSLYKENAREMEHPNLSAMAESMRAQQPQQSPRAQHLHNEGGTASLPSLLKDGTRNHNSPHYDPSHRYDHKRDHQSHDDQDHRYYDHDNQDPNYDHQGYNHDRGYYNRDNQDWHPHDPPGHHDHRDHSHRPPDPPYPRDHYQGPLPDPHHQFTIGSMVCVDVQKGDPLYGVVKWIGTLPDYPRTIAGVELVNVHAI